MNEMSWTGKLTKCPQCGKMSLDYNNEIFRYYCPECEYCEDV